MSSYVCVLPSHTNATKSGSILPPCTPSHLKRSNRYWHFMINCIRWNVVHRVTTFKQQYPYSDKYLIRGINENTLFLSNYNQYLQIKREYNRCILWTIDMATFLHSCAPSSKWNHWCHWDELTYFWGFFYECENGENDRTSSKDILALSKTSVIVQERSINFLAFVCGRNG